MSIVGWSLGGIYGRRLARKAPSQVRQVISLGSPFGLAGADRSPGGQAYRRLAPVRADGRIAAPRTSLARPLPVPSTAVYSSGTASSTGGPAGSSGAAEQNVAVRSSHLGMGHDPAVLWIVADRLAQRARTAALRAADPVRARHPFPPEDE